VTLSPSEVTSMSTEQIEKHDEPVSADLLVGAAAIAAELGLSETAVYHIARTKRMPIGRLGRNLIASRKRLRRAAQALTAA
jgi:hypothetical protein